jgi:foldase protein PrsA
VNGDVLTEQELFFTLMREYGSDMIDDLVENEIISGHAGDLNVSLDPNEVVQYLTRAYAPEKLEALINAFGEDLLDHAVGSELLAFKVVTSEIDKIVAEHGIQVSDETIQNFYIANLPMWTKPRQVRFSLIEVATEAEAQAAKARVEGGEAFVDVCHDVSTHANTRAYGGDIGGLVPEGYSTGERKRLEDAAFGLEVGQVSAPIQVEDQWYIVTPTEKTEYYEPTLDEMRDQIHATLLDHEVQPFLEEWRNTLWDSADIEIKYPIYMETDASTFAAGADGSFVAPTIAIVNGVTIPEGALFFHLLRQHGSKVVEALIENIILTQQGTSMGIQKTASDAQSTLNEIYPGDKLTILSEAFTTDALVKIMQRELISIDVMGSKIEQIVNEQGIEVTEEQILQYYLDNLQTWTTPDMARFSIIVVGTEGEASAARQRISSGESFEAVCRDVSIDDGTRPYGGDIGDFVPKGTFGGDSARIEDTAFSLAVGSVSQPLQIGANWFLVKLTDKKDAYEPTLAETREDIRARLLQDRVAPFVIAWRRDIWEAADISVVYPIYSDNPTPDFSD